MEEVTYRGIVRARGLVYQHLQPTPLKEYSPLSRWLGCRAYLKHENHNPTGSFKIRGGLNLIANMPAEEKARGVITATRGNHGQSIALASKIHGVRCLIAVPEGNNPEKNAAMEALGGTLLIHGRDFDEAREKVEEIQARENLRYIHSSNEPALIHGVGTYALEMLEELNSPDYVFVPLGGGSGICGVLTAVRAISPRTRVVGVQAERADAVYRSWKQGRMVTNDSADTIADGLATRVPFELPFSIIKKHVDDIVTVGEEEIRHAIYQLHQMTRNVAEGAGAASTAAAYKMRRQLAGKNVVLVLSGGNIARSLLQQILKDPPNEH